MTRIMTKPTAKKEAKVYRREVPTVRAMKYEGDYDSLVAFVGVSNVTRRVSGAYVSSIRGELRVPIGSYVVEGVLGGLSVISAKAFEAQYREVAN